MRKQNIEATKHEVSFIGRLIQNISVLDLGTCTLPQIQGRRLEVQENIFLDRLIEYTDLYSDSEEEEEGEEDEWSEEDYYHHPHHHGDSLRNSEPGATSSSSTEESDGSVYRKVAGKPKKEDDEIRLDLAVRIKQGLGKVICYI